MSPRHLGEKGAGTTITLLDRQPFHLVEEVTVPGRFKMSRPKHLVNEELI